MGFTRVVAITGCDSGLGWAMASRTAREGMVIVAGMYNGLDTKAADALRELSAHPCQLDVRKPESVAVFREYINKLLRDNPNYRLYAIVNNAGIMPMGNYEWQTPQMIEATVDVNLLGAMRVTSAFLPDLRRSALQGVRLPRVINVTSHCGLEPLPTLGPYSATKAGLLALTSALRLEQRSHGLTTAVAFIPGGFVQSSNLMASASNNFTAMRENFDKEQKSFYSKDVASFERHLGLTPSRPTLELDYDSLKDGAIIGTFMKALTDPDPKEMYKVENWRYKLYYGLLRLPFPEFVRYWLFKKFLNFPHL